MQFKRLLIILANQIFYLFFYLVKQIKNYKIINNNVVALYERGSLLQIKLAIAFGFGAGCKVVCTDDFFWDKPFAILPSVKTLSNVLDSKCDYYYIDKAYFLRGKYFRITKNAYQLTNFVKSDGARYYKLNIEKKLYNRTNEVIYICPQSSSFMRIHGIDKDKWVEDIVMELRKYTNKEIKIHNKSPNSAEKNFFKTLQDAHAVIVYSSIAGVQAMMYGVPCIALDKNSTAYSIANNKLSDIEYISVNKEIDEYLYNLADNQWTVWEIFKGLAWKRLN